MPLTSLLAHFTAWYPLGGSSDLIILARKLSFSSQALILKKMKHLITPAFQCLAFGKHCWVTCALSFSRLEHLNFFSSFPLTDLELLSASRLSLLPKWAEISAAPLWLCLKHVPSRVLLYGCGTVSRAGVHVRAMITLWTWRMGYMTDPSHHAWWWCSKYLTTNY